MENRSHIIGKGLTGNQLKLIAVLSMTIDHIGYIFFPEVMWLRIVGRIAFPIFAYMIAEGCLYTKDRRRYLLTMAGVALIYQGVMFFMIDSVYQCILVTFSFSIALIYALDRAEKQKTIGAYAALLAVLAAAVFVSVSLPTVLFWTDFQVDYGIWGILLPVAVYAAKKHHDVPILGMVLLIPLAMDSVSIQWYSLLSVPLLMLYNGERGKIRMKNFFYLYYPIHLIVLYGISMLIE